MLSAFKLAGLPCLATEQYPKGLGSTVEELGLEEHKVQAKPKTCFTMVIPSIMETLAKEQEETRSVILCGVETHACIHQTTLDLLERGVEVHIPVDCVSSRSMVDRKVALMGLRQRGAFLTTSEAVILALVPDSSPPLFKSIQKLVREPAADTGLLEIL